MNSKLLSIYLIVYFINCTYGGFYDYFKSVGIFFGYPDNGESNDIGKNLLTHHVPYEVSVEDEKFISEAAKLTGVTLSQLDSCQHRVIYKLQTSCHNMNDEELAKVAVMLLNCQSYVEGRKIYPCSENMSIRDCTKEMDADAWNSYHLITNRARAVCYSVRQNQFRGLTELTINRLMDAAKNQLYNLDKIAKQQDEVHQFTQETLKTVNEGQEKLISQQNDLYKAQLYGQLSIEDNIKRLSDEKRIIAETQRQLTDMTKAVQNKLNAAAKQIEQQVGESKDNHEELLEDLDSIQQKAEDIFQRIERSIELLTKQNELAQEQYKNTLLQLSEFNSTIHYLVSLVDITKRTVDERLSWITTMLGGTDMAIEKLYAILWHSLFLIISMVVCAFLSAYSSIRIAVATFPVLNLSLALQKSEYALSPFGLVLSLAVFIVGQIVLLLALNLYKNVLSKPKEKYMLTENGDVTSTSPSEFSKKSSPDLFKSPSSRLYNNSSSDVYKSTSSEVYKSPYSKYNDNDSEKGEDDEGVDGLTSVRSNRSRSRTPLNLSSGLTRRICGANTRKGTPCKLLSLPGRDYCTRHQYGDSVMVS